MKKVKMSCTTCPNSCELLATIEDDQVVAVEGNLCKRGVDFAESELAALDKRAAQAKAYKAKKAAA